MARLFYILIILAACTGCGYYSFSGAGLVGIETVYVPLFGNATTEFGIEEQLTDALVQAVNDERTLTYTQQENADAILRGRIIRVIDVPMTYTGQEEVRSFKVEVSAHVVFEDVENAKTIMEEDIVTYETYPYPEEPGNSREQALNRALEKLANEIVNKAITGW